MTHSTASQSIWREGGGLPTLLGLVCRWNHLLEEVAEQLQASRALLQLWRRHRDYSAQCASAVQQQAGRSQELLKAAAGKDIADDEVATWVQDCNVRPGTTVFCFPKHAFPRLLQVGRARADVGKPWACLSMRGDDPQRIVLRFKEPARVSEHRRQIVKAPLVPF